MDTYEAVLLDLYDTMVWSRWAEWQKEMADFLGVSNEQMHAAYEHTRPARSVGAFGGRAGDIACLLDHLGIDATSSLLEEIMEREEEGILQQIHLHDDSLPVVRELRERGIKVALVSNCSENTKPVVERMNLYEEMDLVVLSYELGSAKPDAEIFEYTMKQLGVSDPSTAVFVDDQTEYLMGAADVGLNILLIDRPDDPSIPRPQDKAGFEVIRDLTALL